ncbi:helix-turn-helix domain-containing protein [Pseudonocardia alni]|uniref:helix-turn-helix domain-containing protein n=1 Tax=Pseudonocardia alni TaxID=33907 RepID=UPI00280B00DA|nr:helix-turn-helix domain-containing protein [Pseudonocardia alni]
MDGEFWRTNDEPDGVTEQWQDMLSATHLPWSVAVPLQERGSVVFEAAVRRWWIDDLALVDCTCGPCSGTRTRRELSGTDGEFVVVLITLAGRETVAQGDAEAGLKPGDAVVWDSTKPARFAVSEPLSKRSLLIPRAALDEVSGRAWMSGGVMLDGAKPATRLLTSYLDTLSLALPDLGSQSVSAARNATLELFIGALRSGIDVPTTTMAQPALRDAMDRYIERHLLDATVTPAAIAQAHGVSVRTVNRIFNATGQTVGEVIRVRRLARAREELTDSNLPVSSIAHRWGFSDTSHFSRTFKAHYGSSPSDYRLMAQSDNRGGAFVQRPVAAVHRAAGCDQETGVTAAQS